MFQYLSWQDTTSFHTWPQSKDLAEFVNTSAKSVILEYLESVYDYTDNQLVELLHQIQDHRKKVNQAVIDVEAKIKKFVDNNKLDASFIK